MRKYFLLLILIIFQGLLLSSCSKTQASLPENVGSLEKYSMEITDCLVNYALFVDDKETNIFLETAYYRGEKGDVRILLKNYTSLDESKAAFNELQEFCLSDSTKFIKHNTFELEGIDVLRFFGEGRTHYLYTEGTECVYISAGTTIASNFLSDYLRYRYD